MLSLPGGAASLRLWSAEEPHLHLLLLSLVAGGGEVLEIEACQARLLLVVPAGWQGRTEAGAAAGAGSL